MIADVAAAGATFFPVGPEHEVIDEELAVGAEEVGEGNFSLRGVEGVILFDFYPRQLAALGGELVVETGEVFFFGEKGFARVEPSVFRDYFWLDHDLSG